MVIRLDAWRYRMNLQDYWYIFQIQPQQRGICRGWNADRSEMTKGITLTKEELTILKEKLGGIE